MGGPEGQQQTPEDHRHGPGHAGLVCAAHHRSGRATTSNRTYNGAPIYKTVHKKHVTYTTFEEVDVVDYGKMQ